MNGKYKKYVLNCVALAVAYVLTAKVGLAIYAVSGFATLIWPPIGIALAVFLLFGYRYWPAITLGAFLVNIWIGAPLLTALAIAVGNTLEPLLAAYVLKRFVKFKNTLESYKDVLGLIVVAALLSTMVSASIGVSSLLASGIITEADVSKAWTAWWVGDMMGVLLLTPLLLVWSRHIRQLLKIRMRLPAFNKIIEPAIIAAVIVLASIVVFSGLIWPEYEPGMLVYALFLPLTWTAVRFGQRGSVTAVFVMSVVAILCTLAFYIPQSSTDASQSLLVLQRFLAVTAVIFLIASVAFRNSQAAMSR